MSYVFDTSPFSTLFRNYYRKTFKSLWERFDALVDQGAIVSTREVSRELEGYADDVIKAWARQHHDLFTIPTAAEAKFVSNIFSIPNFRLNIEQQKLIKGGLVADPFVVAKAATSKLSVVTVEKCKPNAAKIPNICQHFGIRCLSLSEFMEAEKWEF